LDKTLFKKLCVRNFQDGVTSSDLLYYATALYTTRYSYRMAEFKNNLQ